jgi:alpha-D-xyloside xylohydrolase
LKIEPSTVTRGEPFALFSCAIGPWRVAALAGGFRLTIGAATPPDYGLLREDAFAPAPAIETAEGWRFTTPGASLEIGRDGRIALADATGRVVLRSITDEHFRGYTRLPPFGRTEEGAWLAAFALSSGDSLHGFGETWGKLDKRGQRIVSHVDDALGVNTAATYKPMPWCLGLPETGGAWGVLTHAAADVLHGAGDPALSHRSYVVATQEPRLDLLLFAAETPDAVLRALHRATGAPGIPPEWSFGPWLSRAYYRDASEILAAAREVRARKMPMDVITFDGRAWQDTPTRFHFHFDRARYPDPKPVLDELKQQHGFRICAWEYPLVSVHGEMFGPMAERGQLLRDEAGAPLVVDWDVKPGSTPFGKVLTPLPPSGMPDLTQPAAYAAWRDAHDALFEIGVDIIKSDFGEQVPPQARAANGDTGERLHNAYPALYNRCVHEASAKHGTDMVWARAGWIGMQRHPVHWGGDPQSDWEGMAASIRGGLSLGLSGVPFHATDLGGFYGSAQPSPELFLRWLAAGVFASHLRFHGIGVREPWGFGEDAERTARRWLDLRMRLIPYLVGVAEDAARSGLPVMRAMALAFPEDRAARAFETQFCCGPALLVAPVTRPGGEAELWLPEGAWWDLFTAERHEGGRVLRLRDIPLDRLPVFGREGHALPLGRAVQRAADIDWNDPAEEVLLFGPPAHAPLLGRHRPSFARGRIAGIGNARPHRINEP